MLDYLSGLGLPEEQTFKVLTYKVVMLLALIFFCVGVTSLVVVATSANNACTGYQHNAVKFKQVYSCYKVIA